MKRFYTQQSMVPYALAHHILDAKIIQKPLSEDDILDLQDTFLTNGFHHIKVTNVDEGRSIIMAFLESLRYYTKVGCLSTAPISLNNTIADLHKKMIESAHCDKHLIEEFINEEFYYDFVWIELTAELLEQPYFEALRAGLENLNAQDLMPILCVSYIQ